MFHDGALAMVDGFDADPYLPDPGTWRLRHVCVRPAWRRRGLGEAVTRHLLSLEKPSFRRVRIGGPGAARTCERCGFGRVAEPGATRRAPALPR